MLVRATVPVASGKVIVLLAVGFATVKFVSFASSTEPSKNIDLFNPTTGDVTKTVKPVVDSMLLEPAGFYVVTPASKGPTTFKLSFTSN